MAEASAEHSPGLAISPLRRVCSGSAAGRHSDRTYVRRYTVSMRRNSGARMRITARSGTWVLALVALLSASGAWGAGPPAPQDLVKAEVVPETTAIAAGATLWVDLHLEIEPGWHIYWRNPG